MYVQTVPPISVIPGYGFVRGTFAGSQRWAKKVLITTTADFSVTATITGRFPIRE